MIYFLDICKKIFMKIILVGYMASGKSTIGKILSEKLQADFFDLDKIIEQREKKSIMDIFKEDGEIYFRKKETEYLQELLERDAKFILALGGGTPCYGKNMDLINESEATSFYLQAKIPTIVDRLLKAKTPRPLVTNLEIQKIPEYVAKHLFERRTFYEKATHTIAIDDKSKKQIALEIAEILN